MDNVILKSLTVENFASFANRVTFTTMTDSSKKEYPENTFMRGDNTFNKVSFLYGANGSGKTFFCKILREIQRLLKWSPLTAISSTQLLSSPLLKGLDSPITTFAFDVEYAHKPTFFGIDIMLEGVTYHYEFEIQNKKIISELLTKKYRRTEKLLERTSSSYKDILLRSELKPFETMKQVVKEEALSLPMAAFLNNPLAAQIVEAIQRINVLNMTAPRIQPATSRESFSQERMAAYTSILKKADPTLRKMTASYKEEESSREKIEIDDFENREIIETKTIVTINTEHTVYDNGKEHSGASIDFFSDESLGTVKLFTILPHLFDILEEGGVLLLDEIENGLHLSLVKEVIRLFTDTNSNPHNAQLICTSHQPLLIEEKTRRDQVWIASKDNFGKSTLHRMSDMSMSHAKANLTTRLIKGAFGCNPDFFFSDSNT